MVVSSQRDRLRDLIDAVVASIDEPVAGEELARRAFLSRFHFDRLIAGVLGESPARFRRRLLLERAAFELRSMSVTEVAFAAGYGSPGHSAALSSARSACLLATSRATFD